MNLLVVDDEQVILNGIADPENWTGAGLEHVFAAADADEAIEIIRREKIDIVLTDITMPGLSGLDLCEFINQANPDVYLIILSGYDNFEYARQALSLHVKKYLLKPATIEGIVEAVCQAVAYQGKLYSEKKHTLALEEKFKDNLDFLREKWLISLIGGHAASPEEIRRDCGLYHIHIPPGDCSLALVKTGDLNRSALWKEKDESLVRYALANIVSEIVRSYFSDFIISFDTHQNLVMLYHQKAGAGPWTGALAKSVKDTIDISIDIALCEKCSLVNLKASWELLNGKINDVRMQQGEYPEKGQRFVARAPWLRLQEFEKRIINSAFKGDAQGAKQHIRQLFDSFLQVNDLPYISGVCLALVLLMMHRLNTGPNGVLFEAAQKEDVIVNLSGARSKEQMIGYLTDFTLMISEYTKNQNTDMITRVKRYVQEHIGGDVSLHRVAGVVHMNSNYFSNLFKKKTGMIYSEYVAAVKLEKAKEMLADDGMMIYDIADKLGFKDQRYFSSFFKKKEGINPTQYRQTKRNDL